MSDLDSFKYFLRLMSMGRILHTFALLSSILFFLPSADATTPGNLFYYDGSGRAIPACAVLFVADNPNSVIDQWIGCELSQVTTGVTSYALTNCTSLLAGANSWGVGQCHVVFTHCSSSGECSYAGYEDASALQCPQTTRFTDPPPYGHPWCEPAGDVFHSVPPAKDDCHCGDPIYPLTGARRQEEDLGIVLAGHPVGLTYDTAPDLPINQSLPNFTTLPPPSFGFLWQSSLHKAVVRQFGNAAYSTLLMMRGTLGTSSAAADNTQTCANGGDGTQSLNTNQQIPTVERGLTVSTLPGGELNLIDANNHLEEHYDSAGNIILLAYAAGGQTTYTYSTAAMDGIAPAAGLLLAVTDHFGRSVVFTYQQPNGPFPPRIHSIIAPDGSNIQADYDEANNLTSLTWPDAQVRRYRYERSDLPWALTGITDELGRTYSTYGYDNAGRAVATQLGAGVDAYAVQYVSAPTWEVTEMEHPSSVCRDHHWIAPQGTVVRQPNGSTSALGATTVNGMTFLASATSPAGSGSIPSTVQILYDANGSVASYDDQNGSRTCNAYDTKRDLRVVTVEGLPGGSSGKTCPTDLMNYAPNPVDAAHPERKTTIAWHPDWALKAREAAPKKMITWVYNGQPDPVGGGTANCVTPATTLPDGKPLAVLCVRYEQATTDTTGGLGLAATVTGATRAWTYTYNQYGQTLTDTTPKQSPTDGLSHTTTYVYYPTTSFDGSVGHTMGDLNTVTNPLGQVTTFTSYDKAGRLLSSTDANSTVTSMTYWPRGWLHTQSVAPASGSSLTTTYDYWPTGLLKTVTMPDASTLSYAYDDAHRLTDVVDGAGNKVHYVLDNVGSRTSEQVSDASGNLASSVARVFDALNRVQSTTGAMH